ncbi:8711_t:CDS:2 [Acaulospora morrowiae]|uniref:8711_t:CDS:1 n=1 Tax=Acaulospora morrowiae TaxID=94023 RepID=A0A9N8VI60_9GLOM|nr:8711_t:CDS:2 [Acaulospora morrowiae]
MTGTVFTLCKEEKNPLIGLTRDNGTWIFFREPQILFEKRESSDGIFILQLKRKPPKDGQRHLHDPTLLSVTLNARDT